VIGYATRDRVGKQKQFEDNAWFVRLRAAPQPGDCGFRSWCRKVENTRRGSWARCPGLIKAYYDKKNKKTRAQYTTENQSDAPEKGPFSGSRDCFPVPR